MSVWPPTLAIFKQDAGIPPEDTRDDARFQVVLDAAISFVQRVRPDLDFAGGTPAPTADHVLGTVRLARRWHERRHSPDALVSMGEMGSARVPSFDPDIERLLGIGRYMGATFA